MWPHLGFIATTTLPRWYYASVSKIKKPKFTEIQMSALGPTADKPLSEMTQICLTLNLGSFRHTVIFTAWAGWESFLDKEVHPFLILLNRSHLSAQTHAHLCEIHPR